ncbi:hypothetical protein BKA67DRAFT_593326 [Truncatella angustata]|uniref:Lytic polysaccharide monooxygenase n=1 Tax=Truncatella angustata TaxID=152316 RepID=A0A9P8UK65_9PEZI|nr:uncharacterized protein BKA67DRAFT_593326 [Truncatella angustata]KAH6653503.1 hypothetical protein BKA67DRAFT_593326 [Truncatella angustata]
MPRSALIASCVSALAVAHMILRDPVPYGLSTLNNSPLDGSGLDFPCKQRQGVYALEGASNVYALGSTNLLKFRGQTVHGGGSCQVSITYDAEPGSRSVWRVIKSIEGGCPAQGQVGNMGDNIEAEDPYEYNFTIPTDIPNGTATIAWTWFNKVGNREMYMNCGPITLTGEGGDVSNFNALPNIFLAHIGNGCGVAQGYDVAFPDPGKDVERLNGATTSFIGPTGMCGSTAASVLSSTATTNHTQVESSGIARITSSASIIVRTSTISVVPLLSISSSSAGTLCTPEGDWRCVNGSSYQRCASGSWSAIQRLPVGVSCRPGQSSMFDMVEST